MEMRPGLALLALALAASAGTALAQRGERPAAAALTGAAEVPGPGDTDGTGEMVLRLNQGQGEICYELTWSGIGTPTAATIHKARAGASGPVVASLPLDEDIGCEEISESVSCCAKVASDLIKKIRQHPEEYYVNIHTASFPAGAIRGQLSR